MKTITLVTGLQRLARCLLVSSLLVITGTGQAVERVTYYHNDALGSPVAATDASGTLLWREEYKPYGDRIKREAGSKDTAWYTGKQEEAAFGLTYFGARWYDPAIGRFLAMDPVGYNPDNIHSFSKYAYANNNPYVYVDPDGNVAETALDIVSFGLSLAAFNSEPSLINALGLAYDGAATAIPFLPAGFGIIKNVGNGIDAAGDVVKSAARLPTVKKVVNSNLPHAAGRAAERGVFPDAKTAAQGLKNLSSQIRKNGFPKNSIVDPSHADRMLVPVGNNGMASFQIGKNGTAKLKTTLIAK
jgi:RHS repeat-associated protein